MKTVPIDDDANYRAIEEEANRILLPKKFRHVPRKGSTSWEDKRIKPKDSAVVWKLCYFGKSNIVFGLRREHAQRLELLSKINCPLSFTVDPSDVVFVGFKVENNAASFVAMKTLIDLVP
jgi:hypothetical protein